MTGEESGEAAGPTQAPLHGGDAVTSRLLVIPLLIYAAWLLEIFLLEGNQHTFTRYSPVNLLLYTIIVGILTGTVIPVLIIRRSFRTGDVNLFQIGFRSPRRTVLACAGTAIAGYAAVVLASPFGPDRSAFAGVFLLFIPTAVASVMVCWVLIGTHLQAMFRAGGSRVTIPAGVIVTAVLFGLTPLVHSVGIIPMATLIPLFIGAGVLSALFFFAVRDVYATIIAIAVLDTFITAGGIDPSYYGQPFPWVVLSSGLAIVALVGVHLYLFRNFTTIRIPMVVTGNAR